MKTILLYLFTLLLQPPSTIYDISFLNLNGDKISMSDYSGKRILIASVDAPNATISDFKYLDSIQRATPDIQIIIVPAINAKRATGLAEVKKAIQSLTTSVIIAKPSLIKKDTEKYQHPLFGWLTNLKNNHHFDIDGATGQFYLISSKGTLYAVLEQGASRTSLENILAIQFNESLNLIFNPETNMYEAQ